MHLRGYIMKETGWIYNCWKINKKVFEKVLTLDNRYVIINKSSTTGDKNWLKTTSKFKVKYQVLLIFSLLYIEENKILYKRDFVKRFLNKKLKNFWKKVWKSIDKLNWLWYNNFCTRESETHLKVKIKCILKIE